MKLSANHIRMVKRMLTFIMLLLFVHNVAIAQQDLIRRQAKEDALKDMHPGVWGISGAAHSVLGIIGWALLTFDIFSTSTLAEDTSQMCVFGLCLGSAIPALYCLVFKASPPLERFLGKSPEYIKVYTETYKAETIKNRLLYSVIGSAIATGGCIAVRTYGEYNN